MKSSRDHLTNEKLKQRFLSQFDSVNSQFDLVNYAIRLAEDTIATGRVPRFKAETQNNLALQILDEISTGFDRQLDKPTSSKK